MAIGSPDPSETLQEPAPVEPTPIELSDDALIKPPGAEKPVKYSEWASGFVPKSEFENLQKRILSQEKAQELFRQAQEIDQRRAQQQRAPQQTPQDPYAPLRGKSFVDGNTVAQLAERVQQEGIAPLQQWALAVNKYAQQQQAKIDALEGRFKPFEQEKSTSAQQRMIADVTGTGWKQAGVDLGSESYAPISEPLKALAEDFYYSFEPGEGQTREQFNKQFPARFAERVTSLRAAFRKMDQLETHAARLRQLPGRGGAATPSGQSKPRYRTPSELAAIFHAPVGAT